MADNTFVPPVESPIIGGVLSPDAIPTPTPMPPAEFRMPTAYGTGQSPELSANDIADSFQNYLSNGTNFPSKVAPGTEVGAYDADYTGYNFNRFYNVPRVFNELGFSPYRDNDEIYNRNMSWWDGWKRSAGQAVTQASLSFSGMLPWNAWDGESGDVEAARKIERAAAIGTDTRGSFGAWFNNTTLNSGFTFGILGEFLAEEAVLAGAALVPGLQGLSGIGQANLLRKVFTNMGTYGRAVDATVDAARQMRDVNSMRNFYKSFKASTAGKVFTPNSLNAVRDVYGDVVKGKAMYSLANASKVFGGFYRDAREIAAALSESKLEAGVVENRVKDQLMNSYYDKNGKMPDPDIQKGIDAAAKAASAETFLWNMPAIYLSNKIVFDKAIRGWLPTRVLRNEASAGLYGKLVLNNAVRKPGVDSWSVVEDSLKSNFKQLLKPKLWKPKNLTKDLLSGMVLYTKANLTEGLQELYQEAVSPAMEKYFLNKYNNPNVLGTKSKWGEFYEAGKDLIGSEQGLEIFASGFVMGGFIQLPQKVIFQHGREAMWRLTSKEDYAAYRDAKKANTAKVKDALEYITSADINKYFDPIARNASAQVNFDSDAYMANEKGDMLGYMDVKDDAMFDHIHTLVSLGKIDILKDYLSDVSKMNPKELEEAYGPIDQSQGDPSTYYNKRFNNFNKAIEDIEKWYEYTQDQYVNPFDPTMINKDKDPALWQLTYMNQRAFEEAKKLVVGANYHYTRTLDRMKSISDTFLKIPGFSKIRSTELNILFSSDIASTGSGSLASELAQLRLELKALNGMDQHTTESRKDLKSKTKRYELLEKYGLNLKVLTDQQEELKKAQALGETSGIEVAESGVEGALEEFMKSYQKYILFTAGDNNVSMNTVQMKGSDGKLKLVPELEQAFALLKDFYTLYADKQHLVEAINILQDPSYLVNYAKSVATVLNKEYEEKKANLSKWWDIFDNNQDSNSIFQQFAKISVFFDPKFIEQVKKGNYTGVVFYYQAGNEPIELEKVAEPNRSRLKDEIQRIVETYNQATTGTPPPGPPTAEVPGAAPTGEVVPEPAANRPPPLHTGSTIEALQPIIKDLLDAYYTEEQNRSGKKDVSNLNEGWQDMTVDEIVNSEGFRKSLDLHRALAIIDNYNVANKLAPAASGKRPRSFLNQQERNILINVYRYTKEQIADMHPAEYAIIIEKNIYGDDEARALAKTAAIQASIGPVAIRDFYESYEKIDPEAEDAREQLFKWYNIARDERNVYYYLQAEPPITADIWGPMFEAKLAQIKVVEPLVIGGLYRVDGKDYKVMKSQDEVYYLTLFDELSLPPAEQSEPLKIAFKDLNRVNISRIEDPETPKLDPEQTETIEEQTEVKPKDVANDVDSSSDDVNDIFPGCDPKERDF
jgi:hypothetical protein